MSAKEGRVFTAFTHAGGAGKTSLVRDLGFELSRRGYRVLLVDADPQANLSAWVGAREVKPEETLLRLVRTGELPSPLEVAPNFHLIPSDISLALAEIELAQRPLGEVLLRGALQGLKEEYAWILVDSLPSLGKIAVMAALAGDGLIVPVEATPKGLQAALTVFGLAEQYLHSLQRLDPRAREIHGYVTLVVPTKFDPRTTTGNQALEAIRTVVGKVPVSPPISLRPGPYGRATDSQSPVHRSGSPEAVEEVRAVTDAFLQAVEMMEAAHG